ncbi:MAG: helix-turn-helix domain-containing protein, partial [Myxococcota bacterium]
IGQYVRRLQVENAARQLVESPKSISAIAIDCGFCDQSHLTNAFKRVLGTTPASYRRTRARN